MDTTLLKGLRVLEWMARAKSSYGATDISRELGLTKSNAHRVLKTLEAAGYVRNRGEGGRYAMTFKLWELGQSTMSHIDLKAESFSAMSFLATQTRETVHLSMLDGNEVIYIDKIESPEPVRAYTTVGGRAPAYAVATGKAMLASQRPEVISSVAANLHRFTPNTIADEAALQLELARVREQGFAVNVGEWRESVGGLASPIRNGEGMVVAAIGISGPRTRVTSERIADWTRLIIEASASISRKLGYRQKAGE